MSATLMNDNGRVTIDNEVIARVAGMAAVDCYGVVGMAALNVKDGIAHLLQADNLTKGIRVKATEEGSVSLDFHIIVQYGTKVSAITDNLMSTVRYRVSEILGLDVKHIDVFVEGVRVDHIES